MKSFIKVLTLVFVCSFVAVACNNDDDDPKPVKLTGVSYSPNTKTVAENAVFESAAITLAPVEAKAAYVIKTVTKDAATFTNPDTGFKIATDQGNRI